LASVGSDGEVCLWDPEKGQVVRSWGGAVKGTNNPFGNPIAFNPDGGRLAVACDDGLVPVWDCASGRRLLTLRGHSGIVYDVAFDPAGRRIATAGADATIKLWDAHDGTELFTFRGHTNAVVSLAFSPDGRAIASGSIDLTVRLWELDPPSPELARSRWVHAQVERVLPGLDATGLVTRDELITRIQEDRTLDEPVRTAALQRLRRTPEKAIRVNEAAWAIVSDPARAPDEYRRALTLAEAAHRSEPEKGDFLNTLGVALYRAGRYRDALDVLQRSVKLNEVRFRGVIPADVAFLAMVHHRLGHDDEARKWLEQLRALLKSNRWSADPESAAFLRECDSIISNP
jgi:hypothetical protein